jgi:hypothetical protein
VLAEEVDGSAFVPAVTSRRTHDAAPQTLAWMAQESLKWRCLALVSSEWEQGSLTPGRWQANRTTPTKPTVNHYLIAQDPSE